MIVSINRLISSGDTVRRIVGSLSGRYLLADLQFPLILLKFQPRVNLCWNAAFYLNFLFLIGTLGYVMSEVEDGKPFSQVVKTAKSLGYTEPGLQ